MVNYFTNIFNLKRNSASDWFDPILDRDVPLFIDPFLVKYSSSILVSKSYETSFVNFFQKILELISKQNKINKKTFESIFNFPEVDELCLGFSKTGTKGSGGGKHFAKIWLKIFVDYLNLILKDRGDIEFSGIEILSFLADGIGPDRLSDLTANLIKKELIIYTQEICKKSKIPMKLVRVRNYEFDFNCLSWEDKKVLLPINPFSNSGVILIPEDIVRVSEASANLKDFRHFLISYDNNNLQHKFKFKLIKELNNQKIYSILKKNSDVYLDYYKVINKNPIIKPYNLNTDEKFIYRDSEVEENLVSSLKDFKYKHKIKSNKDLYNFTIEICNSFKHSIEEQFAIVALWKDNIPREEKISQALFQLIAKEKAKMLNLDFNPEPNQGRGPVDFKFSRGNDLKCLIELKLIKSSSLKNNAEYQLEQYLKSDDSKFGVFMTISYHSSDFKKLKDVDEIIKKIKEKTGLEIKHINIDARNNKVSASKIK